MHKFKFFFIFLLTVLIFSSCTTTPKRNVYVSRLICGKGTLTASELSAFFLKNNKNENPKHIKQFAQYYIDEANAENINSDVAFAQMCLETGYLKFGGLVQPEFHNYCGLGSMDSEHPGEQFETEQLGIRAHIQHLQAYATTENESLNNELIDPRYNWVYKTKLVGDIYGLAGTWAADKEYGHKLDTIISRMEQMVNLHQ